VRNVLTRFAVAAIGKRPLAAARNLIFLSYDVLAGSPDGLFKIVRQQVEMPPGFSGTPQGKAFEREIPWFLYRAGLNAAAYRFRNCLILRDNRFVLRVRTICLATKNTSLEVGNTVSI
jgi:hypothetical protein